MKHGWQPFDYTNMGDRLMKPPRRKCEHCGAVQERTVQHLWMRVTGYRWEPLAGRCKGKNKRLTARSTHAMEALRHGGAGDSPMKQYKPPAIVQVWNADGSISLFARGKKLERFKARHDPAGCAKCWLKGWFNDGPQRVRHVFKEAKGEV